MKMRKKMFMFGLGQRWFWCLAVVLPRRTRFQERLWHVDRLGGRRERQSLANVPWNNARRHVRRRFATLPLIALQRTIGTWLAHRSTINIVVSTVWHPSIP